MTTVDLSAFTTPELKDWFAIAKAEAKNPALVNSFSALGTTVSLFRNWYPLDIVTMLTRELRKRGEITLYSSKPIKAARISHS